MKCRGNRDCQDRSSNSQQRTANKDGDKDREGAQPNATFHNLWHQNRIFQLLNKNIQPGSQRRLLLGVGEGQRNSRNGTKNRTDGRNCFGQPRNQGQYTCIRNAQNRVAGQSAKPDCYTESKLAPPPSSPAPLDLPSNTEHSKAQFRRQQGEPGLSNRMTLG